MKHLDLFSGIGGFALAAQNVWDDHEIIAFIDNDEFCQQVLRKHWPEAPIFGDIHAFTAEQLITNTLSNEYRGRGGKIRETDKVSGERGEALDTRGVSGAGEALADIITGGFPCQPFSQAGKRKGTEDDRDLWPEMFRIVREVSPKWVVAENVRGLTNWNEGVVFEQIHTDLESEGYEVQSFILPAVAVNAPHRRDRVWIVGHSNTGGIRRHEREGAKEGSTTRSRKQGNASNTSDSRYKYEQNDSGVSREKIQKRKANASGECGWERNWLEVATELCGVDDGLPAKLDGFELSKSKHRVERLKTLGNAIVPKVAEQIFRAIKEMNKDG